MISVHLPSSDQPLEDLTEYLNKLTSNVSALESSGPVLLLGNFNTTLPNISTMINQQSSLLKVLDLMQHLVASTCSIARGPHCAQ